MIAYLKISIPALWPFPIMHEYICFQRSARSRDALAERNMGCTVAFANLLPLGSRRAFAQRPSRNRACSKPADFGYVGKSCYRIVSNLEDRQSSHEYDPGRVHLIGTGPGDPKLMTIGAVDLLQKADVVLFDRLVSNEILEYVNPTAEKICVGKGRGIGTGSQESIQEQMVYHAKKGKRVVRLKGGDPSVFGRVGSEIDYLRQRELEVSVTPGITTASGVAASLGFPLTHGGIADGVCLVTGHLGASWVNKAILDKLTLVLYMGLQELGNLLERLDGGKTNDPIPAVAVQSGTTASQRVVFGTTHDLAEKVESEKLESPTIIIIGKTVRMATNWPNDERQARSDAFD